MKRSKGKLVKSISVLEVSPEPFECYTYQGSTGGSVEYKVYDVPDESSDVYGDYSVGVNKRLFEEFLTLPRKYAEAGWDGYDAMPLAKQSFEYAYQLLACINKWIPLPLMLVDPEGNVCFEWYKSRNDRLTITFSKHEKCYALLVQRGIRQLISMASRVDLAQRTNGVLEWIS